MSSRAPGLPLAVSPALPQDRTSAAIRLLLPLCFLEGALWLPLPLAIFCGVFAVVYISREVVTSRASLRELGLDAASWTRAPWVIAVAAAVSAALLTLASQLDTLHPLWNSDDPWMLGTVYAVWSCLQELMLQCFFYRGLRAVLPRTQAVGVSALVFSTAHLPNPALTLLTFAGGAIFCFIYDRWRNLYAIAIAHALLGITLSVAVPDSLMHELRVGRDFIGQPQALSLQAR